MNVLIIGYGSIGKRHEEVLIEINHQVSITIVTNQTLENKQTFMSLNKVSNLNNYDYFIISNNTSNHFDTLKYLEDNVNGKIIFCEKPLFDKQKKLSINKNTVYIGYVLRFHPLFQKVKEYLQNKKTIYVQVNCGSYLPNWRPSSDYTKCYSAKKDLGGGVLLDLSHELDYIQWLFGALIEIKSYQMHISSLKINSDDLVSLIAKTCNNTIVNLSLDYFSKIAKRTILVHTNDETIDIDVMNNSMVIIDSDNKKIECSLDSLERNEIFKKMHKSILNNDTINTASFEDGLSVMKTINYIQEQNI